MPLVASLVSLVVAMRARVLGHGACGPLADRRVDAAARREHCWPSACCCTNVADCVGVEHDHQGCCWLELGLGHQEPLVRDVRGPAQLARRARARRRGQNASWANNREHTSRGTTLKYVPGTPTLGQFTSLRRNVRAPLRQAPQRVGTIDLARICSVVLDP